MVSGGGDKLSSSLNFEKPVTYKRFQKNRWFFKTRNGCKKSEKCAKFSPPLRFSGKQKTGEQKKAPLENLAKFEFISPSNVDCVNIYAGGWGFCHFLGILRLFQYSKQISNKIKENRVLPRMFRDAYLLSLQALHILSTPLLREFFFFRRLSFFNQNN